MGNDKNGLRFPHDPSVRGYSVVYQQGSVNKCPGCGNTQWFVGRFSAECAVCSTALPFDYTNGQGSTIIRIVTNGDRFGRLAA